MAYLSSGLCCPPMSSSPFFSSSNSRAHPCRLRTRRAQTGVCGALSDRDVKERRRLKQLFQEAYDRCHTRPMEGVPFTPEEFHQATETDDDVLELGAKVKGTVYVDDEGDAYVDIGAKSAACLPLEEACLFEVDYLFEAGIVTGLQEEFVVVGEDRLHDTFEVSLRETQDELAWERCRQLQAEDVVVKGQVCDGNKGGVVVLVEGLLGFVPFSQISSSVTDEEELMDVEMALKFVEVDEELSRLVLSNRKAMADTQVQLGIGSVVIGTVQTLKPYGAFIEIGGISGLLHVSQISHDRVSDIETVLQPGDQLKVMVLSHDRERGRVSLSTKKLEPTPGDMIRNPELVFEKAEEMAEVFRQRIAQAEAMARADMLRFQPESGLSLSSEGILGPLLPDSSNEGLDLTDIPSAEDSSVSLQQENSSDTGED